MSLLPGIFFKIFEFFSQFQFYFVPLHRIMRYCFQKQAVSCIFKTGDSTAVLKVPFIRTDKGKHYGVMNQRRGCRIGSTITKLSKQVFLCGQSEARI